MAGERLWILDPDATRAARLALGALRAGGHHDAGITPTMPETGCVIVLAHDADARGDELSTWAAAAPGRRVVIEPTLPDVEPVLRVGQRVNMPAHAPSDGDAYRSELISVALRGYATRASRGRNYPPLWNGYVLLALDILSRSSVDAKAIRERFAAVPAEEDAIVEHLRQRVDGRAGVLDDVRLPRDPLLRAATVAAADLDEDAWAFMLRHLDVRRGLFRRSLDAPPTTWQLHPVLICAIARQIGAFVPPAAGPVDYPADPAPGALVRAGQLADAPEIAYSYDFSELRTVPRLVEHVLGERDEGPFTLAIRHDVDRQLTADQVDRHLALERRFGCRSSWYFKEETFDAALAGRLRDAGCEIAYHAALLTSGDDGFAGRLAAWLGKPPGLTHHGGLGSEFFRGRSSLDAAAALGVAYAEQPVGVRSHPCLWPTADGGWLPLTPMPLKIDVFPERVPAQLEQVAVPGALVIVENHPDLLPDGYPELLAAISALDPRHETVADSIERRFA